MIGEVWYLYAFDVANEITTSQIKTILGKTAVPYEIREHRNIPKEIPLYRPLAIEIPALSAGLQSQPVRTLIRVYEVGVVTIGMRVGFSPDILQDLTHFHHPKLDDGRGLDEAARHLCVKMLEDLNQFLVRASLPTSPEPYTICV